MNRIGLVYNTLSLITYKLSIISNNINLLNLLAFISEINILINFKSKFLKINF